MPRREARIQTAIWDDDDFLALNATEQRMYMFLISQDDLAHDGVLALRERRWSGKAADTSAASIENDLTALVEGGFVVVDEDTEELLIRSFIRGDQVYRQPNVLRSAADHLPLVKSRAIRVALLAELERVRDEPMPADSAKTVEAMIAALQNPSEKGSRKGSANPSRKGSPDPSDKGSAHPPGERGRSKSDKYEDQIFPVAPESPTHAPRASAPRHLAAVAIPDQSATQRSKALTDAYAHVEPMSKWPAVNAIVLKAIQTGRWTDQQIHEALQRLAADGRGVTVETLRYELTGPPTGRASPPPGARLPTTDARVAAAQSLKGQFGDLA